jgi:quinol-cytochrome oxidoreductase complex cytochrome b subunit
VSRNSHRFPIPDLGVVSLAIAATGLLSGLFLAFHYAPTLDAAHASLSHLETHVALGAMLRGIHHWCGTVALVLAALHGLRLWSHAGYRPPRRRLWVLGCGIAFVLLGFAYTGYLLPGDERAYTGLGVMESVAESTPWIGSQVSAILIGGDTISSATLTRIYAVHAFVLPALLVLLVAACARQWQPVRPLPSDPNGALNRPLLLAAVAAALLLTVGLAAFAPPVLGPAADLTGAGAPDARPEWFFLWVNQLLHWWPGSPFLIAGLLPVAIGLLILLLPWIHRGPAGRRLVNGVVLLLLAALIGLTGVAVGNPTGADAGPESEATEPMPPPETEDLEARAAPVLKRFRCATCHAIDGAESDGSGPPLDRGRSAELYTREFFRLKVGDPLAFWSETGMAYRPRKLKPTAEQLAILEAWFFAQAD